MKCVCLLSSAHRLRLWNQLGDPNPFPVPRWSSHSICILSTIPQKQLRTRLALLRGGQCVLLGRGWLALGLCGCPAQAEHHGFPRDFQVRAECSAWQVRCLFARMSGPTLDCPVVDSSSLRMRTLGERLQPLSPCHQVGDLGRAPSPSHCGHVEGEPADRARDLDGSGLLAQPSPQAVSRHWIRALGLWCV